jgi:hypothetical protein
VRIEAGITVTRQVDIALHHQVAIGGFAGDLNPWAQMERISVGRVVEAGEFALQQVSVTQRRIDEVLAVVADALEHRLIDHLIRPTAGRWIDTVAGIGVTPQAIQAD